MQQADRVSLSGSPGPDPNDLRAGPILITSVLVSTREVGVRGRQLAAPAQRPGLSSHHREFLLGALQRGRGSRAHAVGTGAGIGKRCVNAMSIPTPRASASRRYPDEIAPSTVCSSAMRTRGFPLWALDVRDVAGKHPFERVILGDTKRRGELGFLFHRNRLPRSDEFGDVAGSHC
jgi:hypothetical protein